jgi:hypothetical protein
MRPRTNRWLFIIAVAFFSLFLISCSSAEAGLIDDFFEVWADENGITKDGKIQPANVVSQAVQDQLDNITNSDESVQLDGLDVIRDIELANALADEGLDTLDPAPMAVATGLRPNDWILREKEAAVWLANRHTAAAEASFTKSDNVLRERVNSGADCLILRKAQLETRLAAIEDAIRAYKSQHGAQSQLSYLQAEHENVTGLLRVINNMNSSIFCEGL